MRSPASRTIRAVNISKRGEVHQMTRSGGRRTSAPSAGAYPGYVLQNVYAWLRRHPWQADSALAVVLLALSADQVPAGPANVVFAASMVTVLLAATVVPRRRYPVAAFAGAAARGSPSACRSAPRLRLLPCSRPRPTWRWWCCYTPWPPAGHGGSPSPAL